VNIWATTLVDIWATKFQWTLTYRDNWEKLSTFGHSTSIIQGGKLEDKDNHLHDMVQKFSSGEISREQYTRTLVIKYQTRTDLWDYHLIYMYMYIFVLNF
jgi:hypothetical protein